MDIVERLRNEASMYNADDVDLHYDAADEIKRLRQDNKCLNEENFDLMRKIEKWKAAAFDCAEFVPLADWVQCISPETKKLFATEEGE